MLAIWLAATGQVKSFKPCWGPGLQQMYTQAQINIVTRKLCPKKLLLHFTNSHVYQTFIACVEECGYLLLLASKSAQPRTLITFQRHAHTINFYFWITPLNLLLNYIPASCPHDKLLFLDNSSKFTTYNEKH